MKLSFVLLFTVFFTITFQLQFTKKQDHIYDLKMASKLFNEFQKHYKKMYTEEEKKNKYKIFVDNLVRINAINQNLPGAWFAVIGPFADLTYMEFIKLNKLTKKDYANVGSNFRNVINCTDRRGYLFERFSDKVRNDYESKSNASEEYYSDEDDAHNGTNADVEYESDENGTRSYKDRT
ncbi:uncharacterized protein LOC133532150 [Cydia pomonella]|uniref:uncharacterized protein LOC133532150 n=1 Tax=Cydia pomonella TaxID=82600 RepID=UPI002ADD38CC|nr:uncharacterized protein LOC133532150 [Cydia pomonella]